MKALKTIQEIWDFIFHSPTIDQIESGYSYYAFISYTEKDEKWAEWLQWKLEHYKIPTKVRNEHTGLPQRVKPIFWYKNDLAGAHLSESIKKELEQSKYLIVVCSPTSAKKEWVNAEVRYFKKDLNRSEKIIPFIVDGEINSDNIELECLPLPIRHLPKEDELRCIDVRIYGKSKALVNIVATLFDIRFDILWNRFKRERNRLFAIYSSIAILCGAILFSCWDYYFHTKYKYFVDMADCNGIPTGIIQVNSNKAKDYYRLYRFEYRKGMLQRVVYVDCDGNPQNHTNSELANRPCIQELSYNNKNVSTISCKDATLKTMYIMSLSKDKLAADLKDEDDNQAANFIFSSTSVDQGLSYLQQSQLLDRIFKSPSKIGRYIYKRDHKGYIIKKMFARHNGDNDDISMDANGISGFEYERDSLHRVIRIRFLDAHGEYKANNIGVAGKKYQYDKNGNITVVDYVDKNGNLKYNEYHWARCIDTYDSKGYCTEERVYGVDEKPCITINGYHKMIIETTKNSETISFYNIHNNPTYLLSYGNAPGGYAITTNIRNKNGQISEKQFKDSEGNLCYNQHHIAIQKFEYNNKGFISSIRNYGIDKKPCSNIYGYSHENFSYNEYDCLIEQAVYDINEMPSQNLEGIHKFSFKVDETGHRIVEIHALNIADLPVVCPSFNGASWIKLGYYGSSNRVSDITFYATDNKPIETSLGAKVSCERDPFGQIIAYKYYNNNFELSSNFNHCAIMRLTYDSMGMETNRFYYDENNAPTTILGIFRINKSYTETGQLETICLYDTLERPRIGYEGWALQKFKYNNGIISANSFYGENKEPIEIKGVHKYVYEIDDCGYILSQSAYNRYMQPTINSDYSAYKVVNLYDENRRTIGRDYYDVINKTPFVCIRFKFNERGINIEQASFNAQGRLIESNLNFGVAKIQSKYDTEDRITYMCATNKNGEKMNTIYKFAEAYYSYENNIKEAVFLDSQMQLANNFSLINPYAYFILYSTDTGKPLYNKILKLSPNDKIEKIDDTYYYDPQYNQIEKLIRRDDLQIKVYDTKSNQESSYFPFEDEYDEYTLIIDSIKQHVELRYGIPKLYHFVNH